jgi:hypothetical protein
MNEFPRGVEIVCSAIIDNNDGKILLVRSPQLNNKWVSQAGSSSPERDYGCSN